MYEFQDFIINTKYKKKLKSRFSIYKKIRDFTAITINISNRLFISFLLL